MNRGAEAVAESNAPADRRGDAGATPAHVAPWLRAAEELLARENAGGAVEALAGAAVVDIQQHDQAYLRSAVEAGELADRLVRAFEAGGVVAGERECSLRSDAGRPLQVLYVLGSVVQGQSAAGTVARLCELHRRERFRVSVLVAEEFTRRTPGLAMLRQPDDPSERVGAGLIGAMRAAGAGVTVLSAAGTIVDGAAAGVAAARGLRADIAVFVASPACAIQAGMALARVAPLQLNMNIGVPLLVRGIDGAIYNNAARLEADGGELLRRGIAGLGAPASGGDVSGCAKVTAAERAPLGVPRDAVMLASAANKLPQRMLRGTFAQDLAAFLAGHPSAWWVGIGRGEFGGVLAVLRRAGVGRRVIITGAMSDIRPVLKAADVVLNEYPEGGCNTVLEAMGCGVPVVAMHAGERHAESIGAQLVGPAHAVAGADRAAYWARASEWVNDAAARRAAGRELLNRGRERFDYPVICRAYEELYLRVWRESAGA